jgi:hypothetical protein
MEVLHYYNQVVIYCFSRANVCSFFCTLGVRGARAVYEKVGVTEMQDFRLKETEGICNEKCNLFLVLYPKQLGGVEYHGDCSAFCILKLAANLSFHI